MTTREQALEFIHKMKHCAPGPKEHESKMDKMNHGMNFIIRYIYSHDNKVSSGDIAKEMNVSTARIAALANKLEEKGIMVRIPDTDDLRKTYFSLTEKGIQIHNQNEENLIQLFMYVLDHLEEGEMDEFIRLSEKMKRLGFEYMMSHPPVNVMEDDNA